MYVGTHAWSASSGGGAYYWHTQWGLGYEHETSRYEAVADGKVTTYVDRPESPEDVVQYARIFDDFRVGLSHGGTFDEGMNGTLIREGTMMTSALDWPASGGLYVMVSESDTVPTGDLCVEYALTDVEACPEEPMGTFHITGSDTLVVTFDGDTDCDGCGQLTVDDVSAGEVCLGP